MATKKRSSGMMSIQDHPSLKKMNNGSIPAEASTRSYLKGFSNPIDRSFCYNATPNSLRLSSARVTDHRDSNPSPFALSHTFDESQQDPLRPRSFALEHNFADLPQRCNFPSSQNCDNEMPVQCCEDEWCTHDSIKESIGDLCFDEYCNATECASCDPSCNEHCQDHEECSSITCCNLSCPGSPEPPETDHTTTARNFLESTMNDGLHCDWLGNGVNCEQFEPSRNELGVHVTENHIKPQAHVTCEWDSCGMETDVRQLPEHLWTEHEPASYVCLWSDCIQRFSTHEELDKHFKQVHCHIGCHWAGCDMVTMSQVELQNHFNQEHLRLGPGFQIRNPSDANPTEQNQMLSMDEHQEDRYEQRDQSLSHQFNNSTALKSRSIKGESEMLGRKICKWVKDGEDAEHCQRILDHGNALFQHVKEAHNPPYNSKILNCRWQHCDFVETTGDRSKLWRHVATHTKCKSLEITSFSQS